MNDPQTSPPPGLFSDIVAQSHLSMTVSDMTLPDRPLVYVNDAFVSMTGYGRDEVLGHNCRFLQGADTDESAVALVRETIARGEDGYFELLNYRRDGSAFWNGLHIGPVRDGRGETVRYFGAQRDVSGEVEARRAEALRTRELAHRMGNQLAIVNVMVRTAAEGEGEAALRHALGQRLQALASSNALVTPVPGRNSDASTRLDTLLRVVLAPIATADRFAFEGPGRAAIHASATTNVALVAHELATNALKHGALSNGSGRVFIDWREENGRVLIDWREEGGPPVRPPERSGMGTRLLRTILRGSLRADAALDHRPEGLIYRFDAEAG